MDKEKEYEEWNKLIEESEDLVEEWEKHLDPRTDTWYSMDGFLKYCERLLEEEHEKEGEMYYGL